MDANQHVNNVKYIGWILEVLIYTFLILHEPNIVNFVSTSLKTEKMYISFIALYCMITFRICISLYRSPLSLGKADNARQGKNWRSDFPPFARCPENRDFCLFMFLILPGMSFLQSVPINVLGAYSLTSMTLEYRRECRQSNLLESLTSTTASIGDSDTDPPHKTGHCPDLEYTHLLRMQADKAEIVRARTEWHSKTNKW